MSGTIRNELFSRRQLAQAAALGGLLPAFGGAAMAMQGAAAGQGQASNSTGTMFDVRKFGAKGDGKSDDTKAIQAAIDAGTQGGAVFVPPGVYLSSELRL